MDFEACSVLFKDFLKQKRAAQRPPTRTIAQVNARKKRKADDTSSDVTIEDRYYRTKEYNRLTPAQKEKLRSIR
jgi:GH35 family endo-1,4-beta-xylanase